MTPCLFARRASAVLFRYLSEISNEGYWILPANLCPIVPAVFHKANKRFRLFDISPTTLCLDCDTILDAVSNECCCGILWARTYGCNADVEGIFRRLKALNPDVRIIDDRCLCRPSFEHTGGSADIEMYSTGHSKYVDLGWGGWAYSKASQCMKPMDSVFSEEDCVSLENSFRLCRSDGVRFEYPDTNWLDLRKPDISWNNFEQCISRNLERITTHRAIIGDIYNGLLGDWAISPELQHWRFNILTDRQNELITEIFANGHFASTHFGSLVPLFGTGCTPVTNDIACRIINLFIDYRYTVQRAEDLALLTRKFLRK